MYRRWLSAFALTGVAVLALVLSPMVSEARPPRGGGGGGGWGGGGWGGRGYYGGDYGGYGYPGYYGGYGYDRYSPGWGGYGYSYYPRYSNWGYSSDYYNTYQPQYIYETPPSYPADTGAPSYANT